MRGEAVLYVPRTRLKVGGPTTFMRLLVDHVKDRGLRVTRNRFAHAKIALIPFSMDAECLRLWKLKSENRQVYLRLDGLFYDPEKSDYDKIRNDQLKRIYNDFADGFIFQSEYSKKQCIHFLGSLNRDVRSTIIWNGTDLELFTPNEGRNMDNSCIRFVTTGNFRDSEMLIPIFDALDCLSGRLSFTLDVVGPVSAEYGFDTEQRDYVRWHGVCTREILSKHLRNSDIFLFSFLNPNCPNAVIEANACGLPVVGFQTGAMDELCHFNRELLAPINSEGRVIQKRSELLGATKAFESKIEHCIDFYHIYRKRAIEARNRFDVRSVTKAYLDFLLSES